MSTNRSPVLPRIMVVTDRRRTGSRGLVRQVAEAVRGGAGIVQVREKDLPDEELEKLVKKVLSAVPEETIVLVNGRRELAVRTGCGLHLPASHRSVDREGISLLGRSVHDEEELAAALRDRSDYLVVGTAFPTVSKPGRKTLGVQGLERLVRQAAPVPVFAIGGIDRRNAADAIRAGCHGVAAVGSLLDTDDPAEAAALLLRSVEEAL